MMNTKNIFKVLLVALFVCVHNCDVWASSVTLADVEAYVANNPEAQATWNKYVSNKRIADKGLGMTDMSDEAVKYRVLAEINDRGSPSSKAFLEEVAKAKSAGQGNQENQEKVNTDGMSSSTSDPDFCSSDQGIFKDLVKTGTKIFKQLRDLIYVVAGFGIIAVAVGGFFGNLNWKWLGAIIISLVVIATAGELVVLLTGCEAFSGSLITNTLREPASSIKTTREVIKDYNSKYTKEYDGDGNELIELYRKDGKWQE